MNEVQNIHNTPYVIRPNTMQELMRLSEMISNSNFCPTSMRNKSGDVLCALQMGAELGLSPMQSIQNIAVINGRPCIWGDAALAVVIGSPNYEYHNEYFEYDNKGEVIAAVCSIKRKGAEEYSYRFSIEDAKKANLWGKAGPWTQYWKRMLQMRARSFAVRDKFPDALRGINVREEVEDFQIEKKPKNNYSQVNATIIDADPVKDEHVDLIENAKIDPEEFLLNISQCSSKEELQIIFLSAVAKFKNGELEKNAMELIISAKDKKKGEFDVKEFNQEINEEKENTDESL